MKLIRSTGNAFLDDLWRSSTSRSDFLLGFTQGWNSVEIRGEIVKDDLALIRGLRILLPPYTGPAVWLYRGEPAMDNCGISWSADRKVADSHARARRNASRPERPAANANSSWIIRCSTGSRSWRVTPAIAGSAATSPSSDAPHSTS